MEKGSTELGLKDFNLSGRHACMCCIVLTDRDFASSTFLQLFCLILDFRNMIMSKTISTSTFHRRFQLLTL